jgi:hypothetical protein
MAEIDCKIRNIKSNNTELRRYGELKEFGRKVPKKQKRVLRIFANEASRKGYFK